MKSAWQALDSFGWNHKYLGAQIGTTMVLHTWGSNLSFHPHVHCIVPGGGITLKGKWKNALGKGKFLFPVKALSPKFKGRFMAGLDDFLKLQGLDNTLDLCQQLWAKKWIVYAKPSFGGNDGLIRYLARYTHNIAISHHRIIEFDDQTVTFKYKDYRHSNQKKVMQLSTSEFIRRLSLHFLPKAFCRIRHFGILSSAWKNRIFPHTTKKEKPNWKDFWAKKGLNVNQCPLCKKGTLRYLTKITPLRGPPKYDKTKPSIS